MATIVRDATIPAMMKADFQDAHIRHWTDAEYLFQAQRWANADHLYGVAAECGLKALMLKFGMPFDSQKDWPKHQEDRSHANRIWLRYESYRCGRNLGDKFSLSDRNPFSDWDISDRYAHHGYFDVERTGVHRVGAKEVFDLMRKADLEGLLDDYL